MIRFAEVFVNLKNTPNIRLQVLLVFRVDGVKLARSAGGCKEWRMKEGGEPFKGTSQGRCSDVEIIVGIRGRSERV